MKVLYAIQGTGNGHLSRARDVIPVLKNKCELDILVSGIQADVSLPHEVKYKLRGMSFIFGKKGGVAIWQTWKKNKMGRFWKELRQVPVQDYDLVINDFEPVTAWACCLKRVPCIGLSHQSAVVGPNAPRPTHKDSMGWLVLKAYAPVSKYYGFHFQPYDEKTFTPVVRNEIRQLTPTDNGHYTVYLPAYDEKRLIKHLSRFKEVSWEVFSKHSKKEKFLENITIRPVNNEAFIQSMASATGVLCGAGFETPAEVLFLGKKLLVIPMKGQYEQHCNAAALAKMNVPVISALKKVNYPVIRQWLASPAPEPVHYPDLTVEVIEQLFVDFQESNGQLAFAPGEFGHRVQRWLPALS